MHYPEFTIRLPEWLEKFLPEKDTIYSTVEDRMRLVIDLSRLNIERGTGGPFGAGIFDMQTCKLLSPGVNMVVTSNCSIVHAEIVAIMLAQQLINHFDLGFSKGSGYELVATTEPCAMCFGAIAWAGIKRLVCGARDEDARNIGFDEGQKLSDWVKALERRDIDVIRDVCRDEASAILRQYHENGGIIYNAGKSVPAR